MDTWVVAAHCYPLATRNIYVDTPDDTDGSDCAPFRLACDDGVHVRVSFIRRR